MPNVLEYQMRKLDNGLTVLYVPLDTPGSACSNIVYNIGSANEKPGEYGLSHLLEHGLHFGSVHYNANTPGGIITDMELKSALMNATTSFYRTNYFLTVPVQYIPDVIDREADRMDGLEAKIFAERLSKECTVVLNEMEIGQTNDMRQMLNALNRCAFQIAPNGHSTIGLKKHLFAAVEAKGETLLAYHKRSYTPDNATLVLVGPFNENTLTIDQLHARVESAFGGIQGVVSDNNNYETEPVQRGTRSFTIPGESTMFVAGFKAPKGTHDNAMALKVLSRCLKYRMQDLEDKQVCMQTEVMYDRSRQKSLLSAWCVGFQNPEAVRAAFLQKVEEMKSNPVTKAELAKAKKELTDTWKAQLESSQGVADAFTEAVAMGNANDVNTKFDALKEVTISDVKGVAKEYLVDTGVTYGLMFPYAVKEPCMEQEAAVPELKSVGTRSTGEVLHAPHLTPHMSVFKDPHLAPVTEPDAMASGCKNTFWKRPGMVHCSVTYIPKIDVDHFALSMMSANKDPQVEWQAVSHGELRLTFACQAEDFSEKMLDKVWGNPNMYEMAGERGKMMEKGITFDINKYSEKLMREAIFEVPKYNCKFADAVEAVKSSPCKVVAVAPSNKILEGIKNYFANDQAYNEFIPAPACKPCGGKRVKQNKTNVKVLYGHALPGIGRQHKDYIPLNIAASILGYGFHGMLMQKVRMEDGLTYGIESHISPGAFRVGATFPPRNLERGKQDIKEVLKVWREAITPEEVDLQKQRLQLMHITLSDNAKMYCQAHHTFLDESKIQACSHADVLAAFDEHIKINKLSEIVVG
tara:strand:+ start:242 stop:2659 length:2418 start_codon:yes stop_codon:yes gene_type:complete